MGHVKEKGVAARKEVLVTGGREEGVGAGKSIPEKNSRLGPAL